MRVRRDSVLLVFAVLLVSSTPGEVASAKSAITDSASASSASARSASSGAGSKSSSGDSFDVKSLTEKKLSAMVKNSPNDWKTQYTIARYYEDKGINDQALQAYEHASRLIIGSPKTVNSDSLKSDVFKRMAILYMKEKDYNNAGESAKKAVQIYPDNYGVLLAAGYVEQNNTQYRRALALYQRAQKIEPKKSDIYVALADCYVGISDFAMAKTSIDKALALDPHSRVARFEKAKMLMNDRKAREALPYLAGNFNDDPLSHDSTSLFAAALLADGQNATSVVPLCVLMSSAKGNDLVKLKATVGSTIAKCRATEVQKAISIAAGKIADREQRARLYFCLGDIYDKSAQQAVAMQQYQSGLKLDPKFARGYLRLGEDYETFKHDNNKALELYEKSRAINGNDSETNFRLDALKKTMKKS